MANNLVLSYDLKAPAKNSSAVTAKIKELGGWARISSTLWYVNSVYNASQARDHIVPALALNDSLFVVNSSNGQASWHGLSGQVTSFIKDKWLK